MVVFLAKVTFTEPDGPDRSFKPAILKPYALSEVRIPGRRPTRTVGRHQGSIAEARDDTNTQSGGAEQLIEQLH